MAVIGIVRHAAAARRAGISSDSGALPRKGRANEIAAVATSRLMGVSDSKRRSRKVRRHTMTTIAIDTVAPKPASAASRKLGLGALTAVVVG